MPSKFDAILSGDGVEYMDPRRGGAERATDGRFSGGTHGLVVGLVSPEAWVGGPIGLLKDGDSVTIDGDTKSLTVNLPDAELAARKAAWVKPALKVERGVLAKYAKLVSSASDGAVTG